MEAALKRAEEMRQEDEDYGALKHELELIKLERQKRQIESHYHNNWEKTFKTLAQQEVGQIVTNAVEHKDEDTKEKTDVQSQEKVAESTAVASAPSTTPKQAAPVEKKPLNDDESQVAANMMKELYKKFDIKIEKVIKEDAKSQAQTEKDVKPKKEETPKPVEEKHSALFDMAASLEKIATNNNDKPAKVEESTKPIERPAEKPTATSKAMQDIEFEKEKILHDREL